MTTAAAASIEPAPLCVYFADMRDLNGDDVDALVTDDDREALDSRSHPRRRIQYLAGRALVRFALERSTGRPARSHCLTTRAGGKLECVGGPALSLSHCGSLLACAVVPSGDVGIDVQLADLRRHTDEIAHLHFSLAERDWLRAAPREAFYMLWVLKEAYLKFLGCGLAGGLDLLECRVEPPLIEMRAAATAHLAVYSVAGGYVGIATTGVALREDRTERWSGSGAQTNAWPMNLLAATASA